MRYTRFPSWVCFRRGEDPGVIGEPADGALIRVLSQLAPSHVLAAIPLGSRPKPEALLEDAKPTHAQPPKQTGRKKKQDALVELRHNYQDTQKHPFAPPLLLGSADG